MGGLVTSLWADARRGEGLVDALVLNSPWLDLRGSWFERTVFTRVLDVVGTVAPNVVVGKLGPHYGRALHESTGGEWAYDLAWKPFDGFPARAGFARAIRRGHARVARGLDIDVPVLVLASDAIGSGRRVARGPGHHRLGAGRRAHQGARAPARSRRHVRRGARGQVTTWPCPPCPHATPTSPRCSRSWTPGCPDRPVRGARSGGRLVTTSHAASVGEHQPDQQRHLRAPPRPP